MELKQSHTYTHTYTHVHTRTHTYTYTFTCSRLLSILVHVSGLPMCIRFPLTGPITGGQEISIEGLDFVQTSEVLIRFSSRAKGGQVEVPGEYVSSTMVKCMSPDFMDIGSGEVEVRVSLNGDSYTTTYQKYNFFAVTDAEKCICFGPGIISGGAPQVETVFVIQAVDATGIFRETGGDEFGIVVRSSTTAGTVPAEVTDQEDGKL